MLNTEVVIFSWFVIGVVLDAHATGIPLGVDTSLIKRDACHKERRLENVQGQHANRRIHTERAERWNHLVILINNCQK